MVYSHALRFVPSAEPAAGRESPSNTCPEQGPAPCPRYASIATRRRRARSRKLEGGLAVNPSSLSGRVADDSLRPENMQEIRRCSERKNPRAPDGLFPAPCGPPPLSSSIGRRPTDRILPSGGTELPPSVSGSVRCTKEVTMRTGRSSMLALAGVPGWPLPNRLYLPTSARTRSATTTSSGTPTRPSTSRSSTTRKLSRISNASPATPKARISTSAPS